MSTLADKIRASRRMTIEYGKIKFYGRRPSVEEFAQLHRDSIHDAEIAKRFVDGWEGVKEKDLIAGGTTEPVSFDKELFSEFIADNPEAWKVIASAMIDAINARIAEKETSEKK